MVLAAIAGVAYVDHLVVSLSLVYLYTLPLTVGAIFLRKEISYGLIVACILFHYFFHYFDSPRHIHWGLRIFHDLSALLCLTFVVYVIQRYIERQELLVKAVQQQRDDLLKDVELAAQVQRLFLPAGKTVIAGLEIAGMMHPARGIGGDYYDSSVSGYKSNRISWLELSSNSDWESNASNTSKMGTFSRLVILKICRIW